METLSPAGVIILRALLGSPRSLNIRNIVWHGFCLPPLEPIERHCATSTSAPVSDITPDIGLFLISVLSTVGAQLDNTPRLVVKAKSLGDLSSLEVCLDVIFFASVVGPSFPEILVQFSLIQRLICRISADPSLSFAHRLRISALLNSSRHLCAISPTASLPF